MERLGQAARQAKLDRSVFKIIGDAGDFQQRATLRAAERPRIGGGRRHGLQPLAGARDRDAPALGIEPVDIVRNVGDRVELVVGYSDTTIHLHEEIIGLRGGQIESVWKVAGRGKIK